MLVHQLIEALESGDYGRAVVACREAKDDPPASRFLQLLYDPYLRWRRGPFDVATLSSVPAGVSRAWVREWSQFDSWATEHVLDPDADWSLFRNSFAWPVYERILSKCLARDTVSPDAVLAETGHIRVFRAGLIQPCTCDIDYPVAVQPFVSGVRVLCFVFPDSKSRFRAWPLDVNGFDFIVPFPAHVLDAIEASTFTLPAVQEFGDSFVLDGVLSSHGYEVFDIVALDQFQDQSRTPDYDHRLRVLSAIQFSDGVVRVPYRIARTFAELSASVRAMRQQGFDRLVLKRLKAPYPYFAEHFHLQSWVDVPCTCSATSGSHAASCLAPQKVNA